MMTRQKGQETTGQKIGQLGGKR